MNESLKRAQELTGGEVKRHGVKIYLTDEAHNALADLAKKVGLTQSLTCELLIMDAHVTVFGARA